MTQTKKAKRIKRERFKRFSAFHEEYQINKCIDCGKKVSLLHHFRCDTCWDNHQIELARLGIIKHRKFNLY